MSLLRDLWRRTRLAQFLDGLPLRDRATFWVAIGLAFALALSVNALVRAGATPVVEDDLRWIDPVSIRTADARP